MADLDAAADAALTKVQELSGHVEEAREACSALRDEVARVSDEAAADWEALSEQAKSLLESVPEQRTRLDGEVQRASGGLAELGGAIGNAGGEAAQLLQAETGHVAALGEEVEGLRPQVAAMVEQATDVLHSLADQAADVEQALEQAVSELRAFVEGEATEQLTAIKEDIHEGAERVRSALAEESTAALDEAYSSWESRLGQLEGFVEKAFADAAQHAEDVVTYSLKECAKGHSEAIADLQQVLQATLAPALEKLEAAVEQSTSEVEGSESALETDLEETGRELEAALAALRRVKETLASYSFVVL